MLQACECLSELVDIVPECFNNRLVEVTRLMAEELSHAAQSYAGLLLRIIEETARETLIQHSSVSTLEKSFPNMNFCVAASLILRLRRLSRSNSSLKLHAHAVESLPFMSRPLAGVLAHVVAREGCKSLMLS